MRLSWCRERAISPCRPLRTERARQLKPARPETELTLIAEVQKADMKDARLIRQIRSNERIPNYLRADWDFWEREIVGESRQGDQGVFFPKTWGTF